MTEARPAQPAPTDRQDRIRVLMEHSKNPRHAGVLEGADVAMPGGSPECGGSVVVYLKAAGEDGIERASFSGKGDTLSMAGASILMEMVHDEGLGLQQVLDLRPADIIERVGSEIVGSRTLNVTLGLRTLQAAVGKYRRERARQAASVRPESATGTDG